jgi:hypothetical protein
MVYDAIGHAAFVSRIDLTRGAVYNQHPLR